MTTLTFTDAVIPDSADESYTEPTVSTDPTCVVCGVAMPGAHHRRKYCDEHQPTRGRSPKSAAGRPSKDDVLQRDLAQLLSMVGAGVSLVERFDGMVVLDRADKTAESLVTAAKTNPSLRKALEQLTTASAWSAVALAVVGMATPILAHHNLVPLSEQQAAALFLSPDAFRNLYPQEFTSPGVA